MNKSKDNVKRKLANMKRKLKMNSEYMRHCPSPVEKDKLAWAKARDHVLVHDLRQPFENFIAKPEDRRPLPVEERGLTRQFFAVRSAAS